MSTKKSNCVFYALPRWLREAWKRAEPGEETYLIIRRSRINWGFFHLFHGKLDPVTGQIEVTSYKPPAGHVKTGFAPVFHGTIVQGDDTVRLVGPIDRTDVPDLLLVSIDVQETDLDLS